MSDPLDVTVKVGTRIEPGLLPGRKSCLPDPCVFHATMFFMPTLPCLAVTILLHENPKEYIIIQPSLLLSAECFKTARVCCVFFCAPRKIREGFFQELEF